MYESPIKIIQDSLNIEFEHETLKAIQRIGIDVDKKELVKALQYDREQYDKGFDDGVNKSKECIIDRIVEMQKEILGEYRIYMDGEDYRNMLLLEKVVEMIKDL